MIDVIILLNKKKDSTISTLRLVIFMLLFITWSRFMLKTVIILAEKSHPFVVTNYYNYYFFLHYSYKISLYQLRLSCQEEFFGIARDELF